VITQNSNPLISKLPIWLSLALSAGILIGATLFGGHNPQESLNRNLMKVKEVLNLIEHEYVDTVRLDSITDYGINKMLEKLDPHSSYIPYSDMQMAKAPLEGDFDGIGVEFLIMSDTVQVVTPLSGGPSELVGLRSGDKIIRVDGKPLTGPKITVRDVFSTLRGPKGSKVKVTIVRKGDKAPKTFSIIRDKIPTHSVDVGYMVDSITGYIKVSRFSETTYNEFKETMEGLLKEGMQQLIIDLRDNPGGYLDKATSMADEFLSDGKLIVYTDGKGTRYDQRYFATKKGMFEDKPVVVLVNEGTASAAEIISGALQDNDRALIVGRRSFGKGLVQMPISLKDDSEIRLTISRYYTPSGRSIQKPYQPGHGDVYYDDLEDRYFTGELFYADSIKFNSSSKFFTTKGRVVYGGGGIIPDAFVALDTSAENRFINELFDKNLIREFSLSYANTHRARLKKQGFPDYFTNFKITPEELKEFTNMMAAAKISNHAGQLNMYKNKVVQQIKAFVARFVWYENGFFPVSNAADPLFLEAMKQFDKAKELIETTQ